MERTLRKGNLRVVSRRAVRCLSLDEKPIRRMLRPCHAFCGMGGYHHTAFFSCCRSRLRCSFVIPRICMGLHRRIQQLPLRLFRPV